MARLRHYSRGGSGSSMLRLLGRMNPAGRAEGILDNSGPCFFAASAESPLNSGFFRRLILAGLAQADTEFA